VSSRRVAVVAPAQTELPGDPGSPTVRALVFDVARRAVGASGLGRHEIGFTVSGSSDVLDGRSFGFVFGLEELGAWPPVEESHVEMDGAFAAWYAWLKILSGAAESALVVAWGKAAEAPLPAVANSQLDPFVLAPLGVDHRVSAGLQAEAWMERSGAAVADLDTAAKRALETTNPRVARVVRGRPWDDEPLADPLLRRHMGTPADGACAIVLAAEEVASRAADRPAWIAGADHRSETGALGQRDLSHLPAAAAAAETARARAEWDPDQPPDVAELAAPFAHQVAMLVEALRLDEDVAVNPSGGALAADPAMANGLVRLAEAADQVAGRSGDHQVAGVRRVLAHASGGHALQQNLVWLLER
jgi:hypothetical protein